MRPAVRARAAQPAPLALCHEWLSARTGSEKTFEAMAAGFPDADLFALTHDRRADLSFGGRQVTTTLLDRLALLRDRRAVQLPLMPAAWRLVTRRRYEVVVTSSHACAKGFWPARRALHLCYCYTPMRYLWLPSIDSRRQRCGPAAIVERSLRAWDLASVEWVDDFAAISTAVQYRIRRFYGRDARVLPPPVDTAYYTMGIGRKEGYALSVSRLVPYKRLDVAVRACHRLGIPLVVAGAGPAEGELRSLAAQLRADVVFRIRPSDSELRELYRAAEVLVFPGEEDFGIVSVEAQACGTPVVAFGRGGSVDIVVPGTGVLVESQDPDAFAEGIEALRRAAIDPYACRRSAERFSSAHFQSRFVGWVMAAAQTRGIDLSGLRDGEAA